MIRSTKRRVHSPLVAHIRPSAADLAFVSIAVRDRSRSRRPGLVAWWVTVFGLGAVVVASVVGPAARVRWVSPLALFVIVTIAASLCVVASGWVLWLAYRDDMAEAGLLGAGLMAVSMFPLVHGLSAPNVWYGPNSAVMTSAFLALPAALLAASPLLFASSGFGRTVGRHWKPWVTLWLGAFTAACLVLLIEPNVWSVPPRSHPLTIAVTLGCLVGTLTLSFRQLRLYWIGQRTATLVASFGLVGLGLTSIVWVGDGAFSAGWWFVHVLDITGVLAGCIGVARSHRLGRSVTNILAPLTSNDPLAALELGLAPVVHRFIAALDAKDPITRDHVVRVAETAMRLGVRIGLPHRRLRFLGLGALFHDIGKLGIPDEILNKPGRLSQDEYRQMQRHTEIGERLLAAVPSLAPAAPFVRSHHERVDGTGYPDRVRGETIPLEARIIAVCDAFDAMANTRQYRVGMGVERAIAVLEEHAGSQWDAHCVRCLIEQIRVDPPTTPSFDQIGRDVACGCDNALPASARELLFAGDG